MRRRYRNRSDACSDAIAHRRTGRSNLVGRSLGSSESESEESSVNGSVEDCFIKPPPFECSHLDLVILRWQHSVRWYSSNHRRPQGYTTYQSSATITRSTSSGVPPILLPRCLMLRGISAEQSWARKNSFTAQAFWIQPFGSP